MEIPKLFGLPAHPLFVHVPVVLIPLTVAGLVALVVKPAWRRTLGWVVFALSFVSLVFTLLAEASGESLEEAVDENRLVKTHAQIAGSLKFFAAALFVLVGVVVVGDWLMRRRAASEGAGEVSAGMQRALMAVTIVALVVGGFGVVWTVRTGHSGATATWQEDALKLDNPTRHEEDEERESDQPSTKESPDPDQGEEGASEGRPAVGPATVGGPG